jgi:hypothetical protein
MVDSIGKMDEEFKKAVKEANSIFAAKHFVERFLALREGQKELVISCNDSDFVKGFQAPKVFFVWTCNEHLEKVGLKLNVSQPADADHDSKYKYTISQIQLK